MTSVDVHADKILILDYGSQYTQLIARRVREIGIYCELLPWDSPLAERLECSGIILSGGPESVTASGSPILPEFVLKAGVPVLGICYGMQLLAHHFGSQVEPGEQGEERHALER